MSREGGAVLKSPLFVPCIDNASGLKQGIDQLIGLNQLCILLTASDAVYTPFTT